jgi:dihydropteroate synthase
VRAPDNYTMIWRTKSGDMDLARHALVMGILNVTVDSFSDGGKYLDVDAAVARAQAMIEEGATIIDIGGESTRPGAEPVSELEEMRRVLPVIERVVEFIQRRSSLSRETETRSALGQNERPEVLLSIDTSKANVARAALECGASIINDVTGLRGDPRMIEVARESRAGLILMHMQGTPRTMQNDPHYENVIAEIRDFFRQTCARAIASGIEPMSIALDPGIGFGKTVMHNLSLIQNLAALRVEDRPLVLGVSRKAFLGKIIGSTDIADRDLATAALTSLGRANGANIFRVHNVKANVQALKITEAILEARTS